MSDMMNYYKNSTPIIKEDARSGDICAVVYPEDRQWYRAEIVSLLDDEAKVCRLHIIFMFIFVI